MPKKLISIPRIARTVGRTTGYVRWSIGADVVSGYVTDTGRYAGDQQTIEDLQRREAETGVPANRRRRRPKASVRREPENAAP